MDTIQTTGGILHPEDLEFITTCICEVFNCEHKQITELHPLQKGLSNSVLSFKFNGGKYVFRFPGLGSEILIDRGRESIVQKQIEDAGVDTSLVAMHLQNKQECFSTNSGLGQIFMLLARLCIIC